ncbi:transcriptional regulator [Deinococcus piscis]|uniref:Transcriptional regulator n=1 Tax=Deinococcus piscis TaxID=394230 RepID=A0ABQ3KC73_9DEIO|nr:YafY family protein [Deinococcus piscis]GHG12604.1 transcriptional regulator [Deinococcus piscis]
MNRTDRLFALLLELRGDSWTRAEYLAETFQVSVRTVYRDIAALNESGVPVVSLAGKGYRLMDGYFLPPLQFTAPEALLLMLGADAISGAVDGEYAQAASAAVQKLSAALPESQQTEVRRLREALKVIAAPSEPDLKCLPALRGAILGHLVVRFEYRKPGEDVMTREVYPLRLVHLYGVWLLGAFDPLRNALRTFRLGRIGGLQVTKQTFEVSPDWTFHSAADDARRNQTVKLLFAPELYPLLLERPSYFQTEVHVELGLPR